MWPDDGAAPLGEWLLRSAARPGTGSWRGPTRCWRWATRGPTCARRADLVVGFYAEHGRPAWAQVEVGGETDRGLTALGWRPARPGEADTSFELASVARVLRRLPAGRRGGPEVSLDTDGPRTLATVTGPDGPVARGRSALDGDWVGLHDLWTDPAHRRRGLSAGIVAHLLDAAAARGALTAYLQVRLDNPEARALYEGLGFAPHHSYRYLTP